MLFSTPLAHAHDINFGVLDVEELGNNVYRFGLRYTSQQLDLGMVNYEIPGCDNLLSSDDSILTIERRLTWRSQCNPQALLAKHPTVTINGLSQRHPILVRFSLQDARKLEQVFRENPISLSDMTATASPGESNASSVWSYLRIGYAHILIGYDHLLVVLCFMLLFTRITKLLWVISGFTLGHSCSLILAISFAWNVPAKLVEIFIILSVIFMARESFIDSKTSLMYQYPIIMSALIGLLHGLGFANVMNELGLPAEQTLLAIVCFNVGVELGQLLFVSVSLLVLAGIRRLAPSRELMTKAISLGIGGISIVWLMQF